MKISYHNKHFDKVHNYIGVVEKTLTKLDTLVSDILCMVRAEKEDKHETVININHIVNDAVQTFETLRDKNNVDIITDIAIEDITTYRFQYQSIVENLLSNALKYSDAQEEKSYVKISTYQEGNFICLSVRDNGVGIAPKYHNKIFTLFNITN